MSYDFILYQYLKSREGICLIFELGVTAIATWPREGDSHSADKSGAVKEAVVINLILGREGEPPVSTVFPSLRPVQGLFAPAPSCLWTGW